MLDLGCGFGWHCRYAREMGAAAVVGVDLSERMLARAAELTDDRQITYIRAAIEDAEFPMASFDVAFSSLALHYVHDFAAVCRNVARMLVSGGSFVFSVEHPVFTARAEQAWWTDAEGRRLHWPVDHYGEEGERRSNWLAPDVVKYHRTLATTINAVVGAGLVLDRVEEPGPPPEMVARDPAARDEARRPMFLLIAAQKPAQPHNAGSGG